MMKVRMHRIGNWILVTGAIRSGTTFMGRVLSLPLTVDYLHEPFNGGYRLPDGEPFRPRYVRPDPDGGATRHYRRHVAPIFSYDFGLNTVRHPADSWHKQIAKRLVGSRGRPTSAWRSSIRFIRQRSSKIRWQRPLPNSYTFNSVSGPSSSCGIRCRWRPASSAWAGTRK